MTKPALIVDHRADLRDLPSGSGYAVAEAVDGHGGVAEALSERPHLTLMDIERPVLDGCAALRQITADARPTPTPIIGVGALAMKGDETKARAAGCDHYVTKPDSPMQLLDAVRGFLGERR